MPSGNTFVHAESFSKSITAPKRQQSLSSNAASFNVIFVFVSPGRRDDVDGLDDDIAKAFVQRLVAFFQGNHQADRFVVKWRRLRWSAISITQTNVSRIVDKVVLPPYGKFTAPAEESEC